MENTCAPTCAERVTGDACPICKSNELGTWRWERLTDRFFGSERTRVLAGLGSEPESTDAFLTRIDPLDRSLVQHRLAQMAKHPAPFDVEFCLTVGHDKRTLRMYGFPDREAHPSNPQFFGTIEDITARLQVSEALVELSLAVEQARDYVCIANASGAIEYVNPAWREKSGRQRSLIGLPVAVLLGDPQVYAEGRAEMDRSGVFRRTIRKTNGKVRHEEITMWPVRDVRGDVTRIVVISSDVTDRMNAEEASARMQEVLAGAAREWRHTVDAIDAAIVMFEPPATIRRMNRAARDLLGELGYDLIGCSIAEFALPAPWPAVLDLVAQAVDRGLSCESQVRNTSGKTWDIIANVAITEEVGDVVVVIRDVTATIEMEESLRRSEVMSAMGNLVAGVAHEVKNPLFGMSATLDAMELKFRDNADSLKYATMIRREVDSLRVLMQDLLDFGRASNLELRQVPLAPIVASAASLCRETAAARHVNVDNFVDPALGSCVADPVRLEQVFRNLIDNAISFSKAGQTVTIAARELDRNGARWIEIEVRDQGPGFTETDLPRVFEPFFTRRQGGTGLGLSIVRRMVEEHGGRVSARNSGDGGAIVRVELPAAGK
ncbi:MAG TPA: ATP-binding protein [Thermoanaerobaculia bacterium]